MNSAKLPAWFMYVSSQVGAFILVLHHSRAVVWLNLRFVSIYKHW